ncbi:MAG: hypothetical protein JST53_10100 [Actinobacteria bacterium]|nr:hypothetical protein [Actinomycetota bacterium]
MLGPGRYLLGAVEVLLLVGFAWVGGARVRRRWLPEAMGEVGFLASAVVAVALLIWVAEALGTVSLFKPLPYLLGMAVVGLTLRFAVAVPDLPSGSATPRERPSLWPTVVSLVIAGIAIGHFAGGVKLRLGTGMTGFDSTWYHGPFAAGFFQSGNTIDLHFIAPQFLAWFYPANSEVLHAVGMLAFSRDLLSPLLNLGWLLGCLLACWCIGRPFRVAPWSLGLGAVALSVPALADQAGEARNDIVGIFFLLAAVAIALNAAAAGGDRPRRGLPTGALLVVGLSIGLAAGTKLNFLLPAAVLVLGLTALAERGARWRTLLASGGMALAGGGYWYLRNLIHSGNPLPWIHHLGPIDLPAPEQALGGREAHSVLGYLTNGSVWSDWFLPGLHGGLWIVWPLLGAAALLGLILALVPWPRAATSRRRAENPSDSPVFGPSTAGVLVVAGLVGLAAGLSWLVSPTSASGPEGMPRGFESGLRYLTPALILGLTLLPTVPPLRAFAARIASLGPKLGERPGADSPEPLPRRWVAGVVAAAVLVAVVVGYPVQRHYLHDRYRVPSFTTPGLDAAFAWADDLSGARIATTSTRQYPLFGTDLSNRVAYLGVDRPHGGFEEAPNCRELRRLIDEGEYEYVVATKDRIEAGKPAFPEQAKWTEGPNAEVVLKKKPTVVFRITGELDPKTCP